AGQRAVEGDEAPVGNGRAISMLAAREGAKVVCVDINEDSIRQTADLITAEGGTATPLVADIARPADISRMLVEAKSALGKLDGLAINVGISHALPLDQMTPEAWDYEFAVNLRSHMLICQEALRIMEPGSSIVLMSSL